MSRSCQRLNFKRCAPQVNKSVLGDEPEFEQLKLKFHRQMIRFYLHSNKYLEICQAYKAIYETKSV